MAEFVELVLTCGSWQEAQRIADVLLEKHLMACAEFIPITSRYHWKQKVEAAEEVKLIMLSKADNFAEVEQIVKQLHSYETPNLHTVPITHITAEARAWLEAETTNN